MQRLRIIIAALLVFGPLAAQADPITQVFFDANNGTDLAFEVPTSPAPDFATPDFFNLLNVACSVGGNPTTCAITFYTAGLGGGLTAFSGLAFFDLYGAQLFSGTTARPTFVNGVYVIRDSFENLLGILTISSRNAVRIAEPGGLALLGLGLIGVGLARRRKRT